MLENVQAVVIGGITADWAGFQFTEAFHRWSATEVSMAPSTPMFGNSIPEM
jgi:hypothetical protein